MHKFLDAFRLFEEKEKYEHVITSIENGVEFRGTNLWVLIFAIFVASLGLNVNSTAVIIGAMLISPLMGPIMGVGLGMGINDLALLKKSLYNFLFASGVGLTTSTIYFLLSPLNDAHSEILARTAPNIYDVLIAFFAGLAGIIATASKQKGNVIPGVAIATALMPPLCTAGYGLATWQFSFFFGALYLFIINTVFIGLATLITVRFLNFSYKHLPDEKEELRSRRILLSIVVLTLLPSLYFGYDIVRQNEFSKNANKFIQYEAAFPNDYLLNKAIDPKRKSIILTYGGKQIQAEEIERLKVKLAQYDLQGTRFEIRQGFAYLDEKTNETTDRVGAMLEAKTLQVAQLQARIDSIEQVRAFSKQVFQELKIQYPEVEEAMIEPAIQVFGTDGNTPAAAFVFIKTKKRIDPSDRLKIEAWLKVRLQKNALRLIINP